MSDRSEVWMWSEGIAVIAVNDVLPILSLHLTALQMDSTLSMLRFQALDDLRALSIVALGLRSAMTALNLALASQLTENAMHSHEILSRRQHSFIAS